MIEGGAMIDIKSGETEICARFIHVAQTANVHSSILQTYALIFQVAIMVSFVI